jgi:hypothetical protein
MPGMGDDIEPVIGVASRLDADEAVALDDDDDAIELRAVIEGGRDAQALVNGVRWGKAAVTLCPDEAESIPLIGRGPDDDGRCCCCCCNCSCIWTWICCSCSRRANSTC